MDASSHFKQQAVNFQCDAAYDSFNAFDELDALQWFNHREDIHAKTAKIATSYQRKSAEKYAIARAYVFAMLNLEC